ncbi:NAD(P)H-dependent oxidoreductase [Streptomyces sp. B6B3]|jgi:NAD(P)H-dependent FMN reductase|uniref:NADPH-dependent FMN reductase n=1 Tax=Streptomyces sp. B6B3 TaxID=3153570 RepID=UPI00325D0F54
MTGNPLPIALIVGSTREGRFGPTVASWFAEQARRRDDVDLEVIDLADTRVPADLSSSPGPEARRSLAAVTPRLSAAEAFVVVTPEYNHSFPASLKSAIDWHYTQWQAKPVGFVSYGGLAGGLRAVEHLRQVFAELHAVTVRDTVSFHGTGQLFDAEGRPKDPGPYEAAATTLLDTLVWWGQALTTARAARPYVA